MNHTNKRSEIRHSSFNLLYFVCYDQNDNQITQGMGRTLNVSEGGILLETYVPIDKDMTVFLTIALEDDLMDFKGKAAHIKKCEGGKYEFGMEFIEMDEQRRLHLKQYMLIREDEEDI
ncbi:MAG: PilZ domain-containing protein [Deltaproteobacteria bacterium]|nr:PilZ domain-containing protein [Deltaproteobacteria bacterium]